MRPEKLWSGACHTPVFDVQLLRFLIITLSDVQVNLIIRWEICGFLTRLYIESCGKFKYGFISSRRTNSQILLLDGVDVALIAYQHYVRSTRLSLCSV